MSGGKSSSSNSTSSKSTTIDSKQTADGEAVVARADGGDVVINQTLDDAVLVAEDALNSVDNAVGANSETFYQALKFAEGALGATYDIQRSSLDEVSSSTNRALDVVAQGFDQALQESREDTTALLQQAITFGIPAVAIYFLMKG